MTLIDRVHQAQRAAVAAGYFPRSIQVPAEDFQAWFAKQPLCPGAGTIYKLCGMTLEIADGPEVIAWAWDRRAGDNIPPVAFRA